MSFFSVPAFLIPHTGSAFHANPRRVGRRSGAAAVLASIVAIAAASLTAPASGGMVVSYEDTAGGLKFSYTGSFNVTLVGGSTLNTKNIRSNGSTEEGFLNVTSANIFSTTSFSATTLRLFSNSFTLSSTSISSTTGSPFGMNFGSNSGSRIVDVWLPASYQANSLIDGEVVYPGFTIASTGIQDQVYTFNAGGGGTGTPAGVVGDTISFQAVPEPSTWALGAFALACGGWQITRRRRALRVKA